ncbi:hypothetical protein Syun_027310 [Stephania yunnanensis]|uniref:Uncharacterized protein n=1 Tax=Stephania yunnanensis TaxID=152371 RepID=A0AAP0HMP5_9MAGN
MSTSSNMGTTRQSTKHIALINEQSTKATTQFALCDEILSYVFGVEAARTHVTPKFLTLILIF